ncbi:MAG: PspA/IM30 family protein [Spirochaetota bacterium]
MIEAPDLSDLEPKDAKRVVLDYIVTLKKTREKRDELKQEFERWEKRHRLAEEKGEEQLASEAMTRARQAVEEHERLGSEERELEVVVETMRKQLRSLEGRPRRSVDAEGLLSQLEGVVGTDNQTKESIGALEAEAELERLKKRLSSEPDSTADASGESSPNTSSSSDVEE